jgi:hypothetical protein
MEVDIEFLVNGSEDKTAFDTTASRANTAGSLAPKGCLVKQKNSEF